MLTNYHTHHNRCHHAGGTVEDYVKEAIRHNYLEIGISCHVPYKNFPEAGNLRMSYGELESYFQDIEDAQKKYPEISILKSLECEYASKVHDYLEQLKQRTDYLILGQHFIEKEGRFMDSYSFSKPEQLEVYAENIERAIKTNLYKILAHPDLFMIHYPVWDEMCIEITHRIAKVVNENDVFLEFNANGLRYDLKTYEFEKRYPYPVIEFWRIIRDYYPEIKVLVNSDCHDPSSLNDDAMEKAREMARDLNLNVLEKL